MWRKPRKTRLKYFSGYSCLMRRVAFEWYMIEPLLRHAIFNLVSSKDAISIVVRPGSINRCCFLCLSVLHCSLASPFCLVFVASLLLWLVCILFVLTSLYYILLSLQPVDWCTSSVVCLLCYSDSMASLSLWLVRIVCSLTSLFSSVLVVILSLHWYRLATLSLTILVVSLAFYTFSTLLPFLQLSLKDGETHPFLFYIEACWL